MQGLQGVADLCACDVLCSVCAVIRTRVLHRHGVIVYRSILAVGALIGGGVLDLGEPLHDYAQVEAPTYST